MVAVMAVVVAMVETTEVRSKNQLRSIDSESQIPYIFVRFFAGADGGDALGITDLMAKLESVLGQNNIDSSVCMQRAVCSYVRSSTYHYTMGTADQQDQIINAVTR